MNSVWSNAFGAQLVERFAQSDPNAHRPQFSFKSFHRQIIFSRVASTRRLIFRRGSYASLVPRWVRSIGLDDTAYGTHTMRRTKASLIYRDGQTDRSLSSRLTHTNISSSRTLPANCFSRVTDEYRRANSPTAGINPAPCSFSCTDLYNEECGHEIAIRGVRLRSMLRGYRVARVMRRRWFQFEQFRHVFAFVVHGDRARL